MSSWHATVPTTAAAGRPGAGGAVHAVGNAGAVEACAPTTGTAKSATPAVTASRVPQRIRDPMTQRFSPRQGHPPALPLASTMNQSARHEADLSASLDCLEFVVTAGSALAFTRGDVAA